LSLLALGERRAMSTLHLDLDCFSGRLTTQRCEHEPWFKEMPIVEPG
jgi:hypothetical protein